MSFLRSSIPHFAADESIGTLFRISLGVEFIDDVDRVRPNALQRSSAFSRHLREALEYLLRERPCDVAEWASLTGVAFTDGAHLYGYLRDLFDYFYGDRSDPPVPPDPEAPMPAWVAEHWP
ncbi:hypothetical protein AB0K51_23405 [Kitasatospora sp. NPDC049285]|uniref:hypothetical protein n=1 Tax=Kitasatospora sp. NPDC049285 TaxID=3157096 RepID=UPI0034482CDD